jgi:hypothetical protein
MGGYDKVYAKIAIYWRVTSELSLLKDFLLEFHLKAVLNNFRLLEKPQNNRKKFEFNNNTQFS